MKRNYLLFLLCLCCSYGISRAQCVSCGTGADGAYHATANTGIAGGTYNYSSFIIDAGVTVKSTGTSPVIIHCTGKVVIDGILQSNGDDGTDGITSSQAGTGGAGAGGGGNGGDGIYSAVAGPLPGSQGFGLGAVGDSGIQWSGGGGAGYSAMGGTAGPGVGLGGPAYGNPQVVMLDAGSGGGGGSGGYSCGGGGGGGGGGMIQIATCDSLIIGAAGGIMANGGNGGSDGTGNCGGGGGGSGGSIWLSAAVIVNDGDIRALGGIGGASAVPGPPYYGGGANGSDGRVRFDYQTILGSGTVTPASGYSGNIAVTVSDSNVKCHGDATGSAVVTPTTGLSPFTYAWSNAATDSLVTGLIADTFSVIVTDSSGCVAYDTVIITEPTAIGLTMSHTNKTTATNNGTATVAATGGTPGYTYSWSPGGGTTSTITGLGPGLYTVVVTDANGCSKTDTVTVQDLYTSVADHNIASGISVYPNPAADVLNIQMTLLQPCDVNIILMDYTGRILESNTYNAKSGKINYLLAMKQYSNGNYFIKIKIGEAVQNIPLTILR